jgi:hypothetical protein
MEIDANKKGRIAALMEGVTLLRLAGLFAAGSWLALPSTERESAVLLKRHGRCHPYLAMCV